jgi:two-component system NtrC family sensor kinase
MLPSSLRFKIGVYPALALLVALIVFAVLVVRYQREQILGEAVRHVTQLSDVLIRSTRFAMLQDQPEYVHQAIQDVVGQGSIEKISIISKEGVIIDTTHPPEMRMKIDRQAEGCSLCHQTDRPLQRIDREDRARIFVSPTGQRKLASMEVIRNEPSCYNAACHAHSSAQSVLGVLDIVYSLDEIEQSVQRSGTVVVLVLVGLMSAVAAA